MGSEAKLLCFSSRFINILKPSGYVTPNSFNIQQINVLPTLTYLLTPCFGFLLEKLTGLHLVKKFPAFHGTRMFITALTSVRHLSLSWASSIQSIYTHPTSWKSILILSTHLCLGLPSGLLHSGFLTKTLYTPLSSPIRATCPTHLILLNFVTLHYWVRSTNHLAPRYAISSIPPLPLPS